MVNTLSETRSWTRLLTLYGEGRQYLQGQSSFCGQSLSVRVMLYYSRYHPPSCPPRLRSFLGGSIDSPSPPPVSLEKSPPLDSYSLYPIPQSVFCLVAHVSTRSHCLVSLTFFSQSVPRRPSSSRTLSNHSGSVCSGSQVPNLN